MVKYLDLSSFKPWSIDVFYCRKFGSSFFIQYPEKSITSLTLSKLKFMNNLAFQNTVR
jgi:hypothetical protein